MDEKPVSAERDWIDLPDGRQMPIWALYIEMGEVERQHPDWSKDELLSAARDLYIERYY